MQCSHFRVRALQHAGVPIGPLQEPVIVSASVVEMLCALALGWGAVAVLKRSLKAWRAALIGNLAAILGVAIDMVALAVGAGPRTASNDLYHKIMLLLATASLLILTVPAGSRLQPALPGHGESPATLLPARHDIEHNVPAQRKLPLNLSWIDAAVC